MAHESIDFLTMGNCLLRKEKQNPGLNKEYKEAFAPG
jgi:hypothetical protein